MKFGFSGYVRRHVFLKRHSLSNCFILTLAHFIFLECLILCQIFLSWLPGLFLKSVAYCESVTLGKDVWNVVSFSISGNIHSCICPKYTDRTFKGCVRSQTYLYWKSLLRNIGLFSKWHSYIVHCQHFSKEETADFW